MEYFLLLLSLILLIVGLIGSVLPALPGLPLSWCGILTLSFVEKVSMNPWILWGSFLVMLIVSVLDYLIPAQGTKRFGGSKYGVWGTNIGLVVGIFAPIPFGFIIGPFVGAFIGEIIYNSTDHNRALKAATGSFLGFLASTFMKLIVALAFIGLGISVIWSNSTAWF
ncbi:MAG: DUF456 domain-containing protein [Flavobacteriaceae bacterium]|jgi:uncharacterized protein YqgC (DUF456 family)|nr:DUF456 domain-containing protein [Flavobacteriaceae bacterium]